LIIFEGRIPKKKLRKKIKLIKSSISSGNENKNDVVTSSKRGVKLINVERLINYKMFGVLSIDPYWGSNRLYPATFIQEQKEAVHRTLAVLKVVLFFLTLSQKPLSISFSEEMVGLFDFL